MPRLISHVKLIIRHQAKQRGHLLGRWSGPLGRFGTVRARCQKCQRVYSFSVAAGDRLWTGKYRQVPSDLPVIDCCPGAS